MPASSDEELAYLHRCALQEAAGGGIVGYLRGTPGWNSPEAVATLEAWQEDARRGVAMGGSGACAGL